MNIKFKRLGLTDVIKPFDCGDEDLNEFLLKDAQDYLRQRLAVTYVLETDTETVAYFSVLNDKVSRALVPKNIWNKLRKPIPHRKHIGSYPSVKLGRLAVSKSFKGQGFGTEILNIIIMTFTDEKNRTGCRFLTVDAYKEALPFYLKYGFKFLTEDDADQHTRLLYLDLNAMGNESQVSTTII